MSSLRNKTSINKIFLVCPTDSMELPIRKKFTGMAFFYTALGVYFDFDTQTQSDLWHLIYNNGITQISFVTAINNVFYRQAFETPERHKYPVEEALTKTKNKFSNKLKTSGMFLPNLHLLAAHHLADQRKRLLSTYYLGEHLKKNKIEVQAYVYQAHQEYFYCLEELENRGILFNNISFN